MIDNLNSIDKLAKSTLHLYDYYLEYTHVHRNLDWTKITNALQLRNADDAMKPSTKG